MLDSFASRHLSLLYGLSALLSFYFAINHDFFTPILLLAISLSCASNRKKLFSRFILLWGVNAAVIIYGSTIYKLPNTPPEGIKGTLEFQICALTPKETHFGRQLIYSGKGKRFIPEKTLNKFEAKNFPCSIFINLSKNISLPSGNKDYLVNGILKKGASGNYTLSIDKQTPWTPIKKSLKFAETRYRLKEKVKKFIHKRIPDFQEAEFLSGIVTAYIPRLGD